MSIRAEGRLRVVDLRMVYCFFKTDSFQPYHGVSRVHSRERRMRKHRKVRVEERRTTPKILVICIYSGIHKPSKENLLVYGQPCTVRKLSRE